MKESFTERTSEGGSSLKPLRSGSNSMMAGPRGKKEKDFGIELLGSVSLIMHSAAPDSRDPRGMTNAVWIA